MTRFHRLLILTQGLWTCGLASANDVYVDTCLETLAGYEGNRLVESGSGRGSSFLTLAPGLDILHFGDQSEITLSLDYRTTRYARSEFESRDEASLSAQWRYWQKLREIGITGGGGVIADQALPEDDSQSWFVMPYVIQSLSGLPAEFSLKALVRQTDFDASIYTSTVRRADSRMELRPGLRWHLSGKTTAWMEGYAERNFSDAPEAEFTGFGGAAGLDLAPTPRFDAGFWSEIGLRNYESIAGTDDRDDNLIRAGVWASYRLRSWVDLLTSFRWTDVTSTMDSETYSWWNAQLGLRFVLEKQLVE